jgi:hypothetical protein
MKTDKGIEIEERTGVNDPPLVAIEVVIPRLRPIFEKVYSFGFSSSRRKLDEARRSGFGLACGRADHVVPFVEWVER